MWADLVAIDLETTGLDPANDLIIEVGAVRMQNGKVIAEFSTLVDPGIPIPQHVTHITGISNQDVIGAPRIDQVLPRISEFTRDSPIIAHNISIDMGFLQGRYGLLKGNQRIDTYDLASILLPRAARYNLNSLTSAMGIVLENAHRALDDARATALLFDALWHKMLSLPRATLQEIVDASRGLNWDATAVIEAALRHGVSESGSSDIFTPYRDARPALVPVEAARPVAVAQVEALLGPDGGLAKRMPGYEQRAQQTEMAVAVAEAFNNQRHLLVEAGTGTGKSLAYLIPAALFATQNAQPVVISTNTLNLQDQLLENDIPLLREALDIPFEASVLKGRSNYLCPRRLMAVRRRRPTSLVELRTFAKILIWMLESDTGDRGEISLRGPVESVIWHRLSAEDEGCTLHRCESQMQGACPFYKARKAADSAHLLIVNHALLISDAVSENQVLPEYQYVIVDEAHQLEEAVTNGMNFRVDQSALMRRLMDLGGPNRGLLGELLHNVRGHVPDKDFNRLEVFIQMIDEAATLMQSHVTAFFTQLHTFLKDIHNLRSQEYLTLVRIVPQQRERASFGHLQAAWQTLAEFFEVISDAMLRLTKALHKLSVHQIPGFADFVYSTETASTYLTDVHKQLSAFTHTPDSNTIYWISLGSGAEELPSINSAPLHVGGLIEQHLWHKKECVILASATLRAGEDFEYLRNRLHAEKHEVQAVEVGSPFNYRTSTLIYLPQDIPEPNERHGYQRAVERGIIELAAALNGRVLALFTSYSHLRQTAQAITPRLALGGISVYDQSDGTSRQALLDGFRSTEKAVLLGTRSFWEGIDIPGQSLSALVLTRLPFAVPTDPIFSARADTYRDAFAEFAVPDAVLRFRQGFGRLIRTSTDRGVVTIFDSRILTKSYGTAFLESLPDCTVEYGSLEGLPNAAVNWLGKA